MINPNPNSQLKDKSLYLFAILASLLLSFWIGHHETVINPDGICYLLSAQIVGTSTLNEVSQFCPQSKWPFYSYLIYGFTKITHLADVSAAYLLDAFFSAITVVTFILIVKELGGTRRILWLAALTILLSHQFNSVKEYIIRDHGFWALYLISMWCLLRYFRQPKLIIALAFSVSLCIATLFRIEGAIFLVALPWLAWFDTQYSFKQRAIHFIALNLPVIIVGLIFSFWMMGHADHSTVKLGRFAEITYRLQHDVTALTERYHTSKATISQHVLTEESKRDAGTVLFVTWFSWYAISVMATLSWVYSVLVLYAWWRKAAVFTSTGILILFGYLGINVIITMSFLAQYLFLSKRYLTALVLILMLWVPFALNDLIQRATTLKRKLILALLAVAICLSFMGSIINFGYSKSYINQAGDWIAKEVPSNASLYSNDSQVMYHSQHFGTDLFQKFDQYHNDILTGGRWKQYDYVVLRSKATKEGDVAALIKEMAITPIQIFHNKRGDYINIYKIPHEEKRS